MMMRMWIVCRVVLPVIMLAGMPATNAAVDINYIYDANGNLIQGDGKYYEYNDANQLVRVRHYDKTGPVIAEYFYDHTGQRIKKIEDGVTTYYIGKHFEAQPSDTQFSNTHYYFANGQRVAKKDASGAMSYYHADHLGGTNAMTGATGNLIETTKYYPFGEVRVGGREKYGFTGKEKDRVTEENYFEARFYSSEIHRFTQPDSIFPSLYDPQGLNRYTYVRNNPLNYIDPTGHVWWNPVTWNKSDDKSANSQREWLVATARGTVDAVSMIYESVRNEAPELLTKSDRYIGSVAKTISKVAGAVDLLLGAASTNRYSKKIDSDSRIPDEHKTSLKLLYAIEAFALGKYLAPGSKALLEKHGASNYAEHMSRRNSSLKALIDAPGTDIDPKALASYEKTFGH